MGDEQRGAPPVSNVGSPATQAAGTSYYAARTITLLNLAGEFCRISSLHAPATNVNAPSEEG